MDLIELPTAPDGGDATCAGCGATLAPDQRYCLACGRPCSPVRLAFLDVLQAERQPTAAHFVGGGAIGPHPPHHPAPAREPDGALGSLRRYSGLLALLGVLVGCLLIGLLVGHWVSADRTPAGPQVVRIEGLTGPLASAASPAAAATTASPTTNAASPTASTASSPGGAAGAAKSTPTPTSSKAEEAQEAREAKEKEAKPPPPVSKRTSSGALQKLDNTTGRRHAQEVNAALGNGPIETGH